jgi:hypothetical protein
MPTHLGAPRSTDLLSTQALRFLESIPLKFLSDLHGSLAVLERRYRHRISSSRKASASGKRKKHNEDDGGGRADEVSDGGADEGERKRRSLAAKGRGAVYREEARVTMALKNRRTG